MAKIIGMGLLLGFLSILSGCGATSYQSARGSFTGGHWEENVNNGILLKVGFSGNGLTSTDVAQKYFMYRCAELAKYKNKPYFILYATLREAVAGKPSAKPSLQLYGNHPHFFGYITYADSPLDGSLSTEKTLADLDPIVHPKKTN